ncbi:MAG TPA: aminotransferase class V-fold PLP-dependent enzyme [Candidatus Ornithospirochaeta avicola]|uniref:cysteine desulfurase n=1 Tax=Candidatus Ornithospirochaeta avicola TaxID=2840896 RepID=A0A9D1PSM7_9SPIO|nr:aminotransferase class V-fold PLP-dependent enzyme [Candidatus Ornithospirochaeta avicola]
MERFVYLDNNATTEMDRRVVDILHETEGLYANASSMHQAGQNASSAIEWAREKVASLLGAKKNEIYFTSGSTEGNNTVFNIFRDLIDERKTERRKIVLSAVEHPASIETAKYLKKRGYKIETIPVDKDGFVILEEAGKIIDDDTLFVSVMTANNESGAIEPVKEIAKLAKAKGAYVHTDATQAIGKIAVNVDDLGVDYLTLSAHKFYGPKGVGALYIRTSSPKSPYIHGGHQENGMRAGTYNTQAIVGLGKAAEIAKEEQEEERKKLWALREKLRKGISEKIKDVVFNSVDSYERVLPGTLDVSFLYAEGESILLYLDLEGIAVSTGSACASGSLEPSYVLLATGMPVEQAHGSIRFSFGRFNTEEDVDYVLEKLPPIIEKIRKMSTRR